jgi:uncharacterized protein YkwD
MAAAIVYGTAAMGLESPSPTLEPWLDTSDRDVVVAAYEAAFAAEVPDLDWQGDRDGCDPGTSSQDFRTATIDRVNYYRAMAGVTADVTEDPARSDKAREAAMMMSAQGELTHSPAATFACFTPIGQEAAANSNLYLGRNGPRAIDGYIEDPGDDNADVGHRNTILHPPTRRMGVGDVDRTPDGHTANALWVFDERVFDETESGTRPAMREADRFVAWPPRGYVPADLVHPRWSFTLAGADVSRAEVSLYRMDGTGAHPVPLTVVNRSGAPGHVPLPTVVWEPAVTAGGPVDVDYLVVITGVAPEQPILAASDGSPVADPIRPVYSYMVRILGDAPSGRLTPSEALERIDRT